MKKILLTIVAALMCIVSAQAQQFTEIVMDADNKAEVTTKTGQNYFQHTATESCELRINVGYYGTVIYQCERDGVAYSTPLALDRTAGGNEYKINIEEGRTYYFTTNSVAEAHKITFYYSDGDNSITMSSNYDDGAVVNTASNNLELTFDRTVTATPYVSYGDGQREEISSSYVNAILTGQYFYSITLNSLISYLLDGNKIAVGDKFTITIENIADAANPDVIYGEDGTFSITFELGELPATLVSTDPADGSTIYTYYPEGGDEGLITFTFSEELNSSTDGVSVTASYGDMGAGSYESFNLPFTISGNTVTADIRGIRFPEYVDGGRGSSSQPTSVRVALSGLTTPDGRTVITNYPNAGTSAVMVFYTVVKQEISFIYDFMPQSGTDEPLSNYDEIMIWLNNPIMYDGITQTWYNARGQQMTRSFTSDEITFEWSDEYYGYVAYVPVSDISYNDSPVTLTVDNAYLMNGDPVTITGTFNNDQTVTGIDTVETADGSDIVTVYDITGTQVRRAAASEALDGLAKGIYIVNGKKHVVK